MRAATRGTTTQARQRAKLLCTLFGSLVLAITALSGTAAAAPPPAEFTDPAGDSGPGPDITKLTVSADDAGTITFRVEIPNRPAIGPSHSILVFIDADSNRATGDRGTDYALGMLGSAVALLRWNGTGVERVDPSSASGSYANGVATLSVKASDLGITAGFLFWVGTTDNVNDDSNWDPAPEYGTHSYNIQTPPPPPPPTITRILTPAGVLLPKPGKTLAVRGIQVEIDGAEIVDPETLECTLKLAGKTVTPLAGGCKWRIPKTAAGKRGTLILSLGYQEATTTQRFPVKVGR